MTNKLIYIASPYAGDVQCNVEFAKAACHYAMELGHTPVAVHLLYPQFLDVIMSNKVTVSLPTEVELPKQHCRPTFLKKPPF